MSETLRATADRLIAHCRANTTEQGLEELYDPACISVEAAPGPGQSSAETHGIDGIKGKHAWWAGAMEVHSQDVEGPFLHGSDRFAVIFAFDATDKAANTRISMREVAIYTVNPAGKITREEFFYTM